MSFENQISILYNMRFLENEGDDIEVFEDILNQISLQGTVDVIPDLCKVFDDDLAQPSAGDYLIETIFYIAKRHSLEEGLQKIACSIPAMLPHAEFWAERIHRTLLHSDDLLVRYKTAIMPLDRSTKQVITDILHTIKQDDPEIWADKVNVILPVISK